MASLLTDVEKATLKSAMADQHDTFAREITYYKDAKQTVSAPSNSFNSIYGRNGATTSISYTPQSFTVNARVLYSHQFDQDVFHDNESDSELKIRIDDGSVRIKIKASDFANVKEAKRFEFDNRKFYIDSDFRGHGLFDVQYYTFYVKPEQ